MYTDGSGIDGKIGAAAVVDLEDRHAHSQMGDDDTSTVFAAELRAIEMALTMAQESTEPWAEQAKNGIVIFADSQAALRAATTTHAIRTRCLDLIQQFADKGVWTELRWTPAHQGVIGNEIADQHAKDAAQGPEGPQNSLNRGIRLARRKGGYAVKQSWSGRSCGQRKRPVDRRNA
ncbi:hypothetical protein N7461_001422 [Penicillium sp. DV-2018c]|nr:hypothetical protein N7461_001422 [Penicillium sp. DV-2018c]